MSLFHDASLYPSFFPHATDDKTAITQPRGLRSLRKYASVSGLVDAARHPARTIGEAFSAVEQAFVEEEKEEDLRLLNRKQALYLRMRNVSSNLLY